MERTPVVERIQKRLSKPSGDAGCWLFTGAKTVGYGVVSVSRGITRQVHVIMWEHANGLRPPAHDIHHRCHNRACCNPDHLEPMPHRDHPRLHSIPRQTHCSRGHELTDGNSYLRKTGQRMCRLCAIARSKARKDRLRKPQRTHCNRGLHPWIPENWMRTREGMPIKRCRLCWNAKQNAERRAGIR